MHAHLGLAFCVESIKYARFLRNDQTLILDHLGSVSYPFAYNESEFFTSENISLLVTLINSKILSDQHDFKDLSVSIESNLATMKRIALPDNLDKQEEDEQITWDLAQSLIEPLDQYIYFKTINIFENDNYKDYLTIAIRKNIINSIKRMSELLNLNLIDVSINQLVAEIALRNFLKDQTEGLIACFKIGVSRLESTFFWDGNFYTSHYERSLLDVSSVSMRNELLTKIKSKVKQMENLFAQMTQKQIKIERIFLYGDSVEEKFINSLKENISVVVFRLNPLKNIDSIIKDSSFIPDFKSHLTKNILTKISNEEIKKVLKRKLIIKEIPTNNNQIKDQGLSNFEFSSQGSLDIIENSEINNEIDHLPETLDSDNIDSRSIPSITKVNKIITSEVREESKIKPIERAKSTLKFTPKAKDYEFQYQILKDPTGKLYTNGDYEDFYNLTLDKYNKLIKLMRKRPEVHNADNINNILRLTNKIEVSVIGFVNDSRITKNGNFFLNLEDLTGTINVLIRKDSEYQETTKITERTINDQMVYIEGTYSPGEKGRAGIIYGTYMTKIDIPKDYEPNVSNDPLSIALISDTHIGSKEFEEKLWNRFVDLLKGKIGNKSQRERAGRIKYLIINGDLVDGVGIYPSQEDDLIISDIFQQFNKAAELLSELPDYIKIFYSPGNHEPVRNAIPRPAVPTKYSQELINLGIICVGNPSIIQTHNINTLIFHGDSILDLNMLIPGLENNKPTDTMEEFLRCRHLAPIFGKKTQIAPTNKDWLVIDKIPDIFHTGHIHINGMNYYNRIALVNSGCFQNQTDFMNSLGIQPTPGILSLIDLDSLKGTQLDLKSKNL